MPRPAVFFDRDNTLIACDGYLGDPDGVKLCPGAAESIARLRARGFAIVVVSNQSGVGRGYFDEDAVRAVNARLDALLLAADSEAIIDRHEFCPFHPEATVEAYRRDSDLRKPAPGMLLKAAREMDLDLHQSWLIGDTPRDIDAGAAAGCRTILLRDPTLSPSPEAARSGKAAPDFIASSLTDAAAIIASAPPRPPASP
jgi:D-glycero-D-manno-heptose 1,7-bisphosphate phosphatase